jgi:uncharacterized membrane protein YidH (DUF202 family)
VLELKIATHALESSAEVVEGWIRLLTEKGGAIEVSKFSKYLSGYAAHFPKKIDLVPSWMNDEEITACLQSRVRGASFNKTIAAPDVNSSSSHHRPVAGLTTDSLFSGGRGKMYDRNEKKKMPDQKSVLANERTLLAWVRTTMLILFGSSFFLENDLPGPTNAIFGYCGIVTGVALIMYAYSQYRTRNEYLCDGEGDLRKYVDKIGTAVLFVSVVVSVVAGAIAYKVVIIH